MKTIRNILLGALLCAAAIFAISNRGAVTLDLWPFPFVLETTAGVLVLIAFAAGLFIGTFFAALSRVGTGRISRGRKSRETSTMLSEMADDTGTGTTVPSKDKPRALTGI